MIKPDIKGLTKLARVIERTSKKNFNMEHWWHKTPCGTSGCIAGHAATIFPHRFKKVVSDDYDIYANAKTYDIMHRRTETTGEEAFANGFHIPQDDANEITIEHMYRTPKQAAKAIMVLVGKLKKQG